MNSYYQTPTGGTIQQNPSNEKQQSTYPNMTYSPQGGLPPGAAGLAAPSVQRPTTYASVPVSVGGYSSTGQVFAAGPSPYANMANGYRGMTPTSYVSAQAYQPPTTVSAYRTVSPQYAAPRYPVAQIPSQSYPAGAIPRSPTYPATSYLAAAHNSLNGTCSLAYPGTSLFGSNSSAGYPMPGSAASYYAGPPSYQTSPYAAAMPAANPYQSGTPTLYPGSTPYTMPRP